MPSRNPLLRRPLGVSLALMLFSHVAMAHTGAGSVEGFVDGLAHPLHGVDHWLTMVAVGLWAASLGGSALWLVPLSFLTLMAIGAGVQVAGMTLPQPEWMVATSVLMIGLGLWQGWRTTPRVAATLVGLFALFHGYVHAAERGSSSTLISYGGGFLSATLLLHLLGLFAGLLMTRKTDYLSRIFGVICTGSGIVLLTRL